MVTTVPNLHRLKEGSRTLALAGRQMSSGSRLACESQLTGTRGFAADFRLTSFTLAVHATHLGCGGVAEAYAGDDPLATGHRARRPGRPVAPGAVLFDCEQHPHS